MDKTLTKLTLRGFKSFESLEDFELGDLNVLVGANGAGKSNFVEFFRLLRAMVHQSLQTYMIANGPADGYFFNGLAYSRAIEAKLSFGETEYAFKLASTADGKIFVAQEIAQYSDGSEPQLVGKGSLESTLKERSEDFDSRYARLDDIHGPNWRVWSSLSNLQVYHFHDTSKTSYMRREYGVEQSDMLDADAGNLAPLLYRLREEYGNTYQLIRKTLQRIAPYFDDFLISGSKHSREDTVRLTWRQKGKDYIFSPGHFSDGTIRFLCLATALLQPNPPSIVVIDEPELGLHPEAISILGGMIRSASKRMQIIVATQSPQLLNEFLPEQVITVDQSNGASVLRRLSSESISEWLDEFSVGELWQKGTISGGINDA